MASGSLNNTKGISLQFHFNAISKDLQFPELE